MLNSGRILYQFHSCTMSRKSPVLTRYANAPYVLIHPEDLSARGFSMA